MNLKTLVMAGIGIGMGYICLKGCEERESGATPEYNKDINTDENFQYERLRDKIRGESLKGNEDAEELIVDLSILGLRDYNEEIFDRLSSKEFLGIMDDAVRYKTRKIFRESGEIAEDGFDKFLKTEFYEEYIRRKEKVSEDFFDKLKETKLYKNLMKAGENFSENVKRRLKR